MADVLDAIRANQQSAALERERIFGELREISGHLERLNGKTDETIADHQKLRATVRQLELTQVRTEAVTETTQRIRTSDKAFLALVVGIAGLVPSLAAQFWPGG